jgi:hypothetical protein
VDSAGHDHVLHEGLGQYLADTCAYLGHNDPGFTLRTYTHLLPTSEDRTRRAIDRAFQDGPEIADGLKTA